MMSPSNKLAYPAIRKLFMFLKPYRFWLAVKLFSSITNAANDIFLVYLINLLVDSSLAADKAGLMKFIYMMIGFVAVGICINYLETYSSGRFSAYAARDMKDEFGSRMNKLPASYLEKRHSGELISHLTNDINKVESFFKDVLMGIVFHFIRLAACIGLLLYMNWQLTIVTMLVIPLMAVLTSLIGRPLNGYSSRAQTSLANINSVVQDTIKGIHIVKAYNLVDVLFRKFKKANDQLLADSYLIEKRNAAMDSVSVLVRMVPFLIFFLFGGYMVIHGSFTAGGFIAFAQLVNYLVQTMGVLPNLIGQFKIVDGVASHLFELMEVETERTGGKQPTDFSPNVPAIEFNHVSFTYDGVNKVLDEFSFVLSQGKKVALVGPSGSGKSTVFKLIAGFYECQNGSVRMFDIPLKEWELASARLMISMVSQEAFLFTGTIKENIVCGKTDVSPTKLELAARTANIHEFIRSLPQGYDTPVGERGVNLSGGQRQRISIARAILKDAPILLLDEPTSALDSESELLVQEAINRVMESKTVLVIAHRLSTIIESDLVVVLHNGRISEYGTHHELLAKEGVYKRLYHNQLNQPATTTVQFDGRGD